MHQAMGRLTLAAWLLAGNELRAGGSLGIPTHIDGYPTNVGLLILGHSTSAQGDYPAKLAAALNDPGNLLDGRNYQVLRAVTGGDGGLLWSIESVSSADPRYERVRTSAGPSVGGTQWCEDASGVRWSCRRAKVEKLLTGQSALPSSGSCALASLQNGCSPGNAPGATLACTYYDRSLPPGRNPVTQTLSYHDCWLKMDYHLALVQDTSNRSWPIDDYNVDGEVDQADFWPATRIPPLARPCLGTSGEVQGSIDWNCDGALSAADAAHAVYAGWLQQLGQSLLDQARYGPAALEHVFVIQKPLELGQCNLYPAAEQAVCNADRHALRSPEQVAATPARPLDRYFVPTVYWEYRVIQALFGSSATDPRIQRVTRGARVMTYRSEKCYESGLAPRDWTIPATVPDRPTNVPADDGEDDAGGGDADTRGCMSADHVHHNAAGGWMMADVWYAGLLPYLQ